MTDKRNPFEKSRSILKELSADKITDMTARGQNLSMALEELDPTHNYAREDVESNFDAFERVLLSAGIVPRPIPERHIEATTLNDLNQDPKARLLIGELIGRSWRKVAHAGGAAVRSLNTSQDAVLGSMLNQYQYPASVRTPALQAAIPVSELVGITTPIDKTYYRPFQLLDIEEDGETMARIAEGTEVPAIKLENTEKQITLKKTGRRIDATYESLRQLPIDLLAYYVQRVAIKVEADKVNKIIATLIAGDGNSGTAATNYELTDLDPDATVGQPTFKSWLSFRETFDNPFVLTHIFARKQALLDVLLLDSGTGNVPLQLAGGIFASQQFEPINQNFTGKVRYGKLNSVPANLIVGIDKRVAVERIYEVKGTIREVDKWIREQKESLVMTEMEGYAINEPLAVKTFQLDA